jgi:hypothetical protein
MSKSIPQLRTYSGNCHCGAFTFHIEIPDLRSVVECNCYACAKYGFKWIFPGTNHFAIERGDGVLKEYVFGAMVNKVSRSLHRLAL